MTPIPMMSDNNGQVDSALFNAESCQDFTTYVYPLVVISLTNSVGPRLMHGLRTSYIYFKMLSLVTVRKISRKSKLPSWTAASIETTSQYNLQWQRLTRLTQEMEYKPHPKNPPSPRTIAAAFRIHLIP